eukprot:1741024-Amphidinium_carterae.1
MEVNLSCILVSTSLWTICMAARSAPFWCRARKAFMCRMPQRCQRTDQWCLVLLKVTNAQFPDAIKTLKPVTQLYVSVDAPNPEAMESRTAIFPNDIYIYIWALISRPHRAAKCCLAEDTRPLGRMLPCIPKI